MIGQSSAQAEAAGARFVEICCKNKTQFGQPPPVGQMVSIFSKQPPLAQKLNITWSNCMSFVYDNCNNLCLYSLTLKINYIGCVMLHGKR